MSQTIEETARDQRSDSERAPTPAHVQTTRKRRVRWLPLLIIVAVVAFVRSGGRSGGDV